ncbi:phosphatase PAP2 family protein [Novosphingobium sp.]|uniref:phosphatase PAP2 family protein n=1 Tax=Novosphingobium sp. TaxID=1874826 RepID=UPI00260F43D0|nr:phosphatase PAP2 family protein [Novosphingobium sp.]
MPPLAVSAALSVVPDAQGVAVPSPIRASWLVIAFGFVVALLTLAASGIGIAVMSVGPLAFLAATLVGVQFHYTRNRPDARIAATCGILAMLIAACLLAAIISHTSLRFGSPHIDSALSAADLALGIRAPAIVLAFADYPAFAALLSVIYSSAMPVCIVLGLALAVLGREAKAWEFGFCFTFCLVLAAIVSIGFPALGSTVYHGIEGVAGLPSDAGNFHMATVDYYRNDPAAIFDLAKVQGIVTFPSFHMVMALLVPYALRGTGLPGWIAMVWAVLVTISSVVIGGHYVVDLLGGAMTWAASAWWIGRASR